MLHAWGGIDAPREEQAAALADTLFTEPVAYSGAAFGGAPFKLEGAETLIPAWVKPAEDGNGMILRLHETRGQCGAAKLTLADGWKGEICKMDETTIGKLGGKGELAFRANQIVSVHLFR